MSKCRRLVLLLLSAFLYAAGLPTGIAASGTSSTSTGSTAHGTRYIVTIAGGLGAGNEAGTTRRLSDGNGIGARKRKGVLASLAKRAAFSKILAEGGGQKRGATTTSRAEPSFSAIVTTEYGVILNGFAGEFSPDALAFLSNHDDVVTIEKDRVVKATLASTRGSRKKDKKASLPWGLDRIDQDAGQLDGSYAYAAPDCLTTSAGCGVRLYVIDTGIYSGHNEFKGRILPGYNFYDDNADAEDCDGHGSHCASTAAGTLYGVAKDVQIVPLRVLDCGGYGDVSDFLAALEWAVKDAERAGVRGVASVSLGYGPTVAGDLAVNNAVKSGFIVVAAAGNAYGDACDSFPASAQMAITVGSTQADDNMSGFSNYGKCVDVFGPGTDVLAAGLGDPDATASLSGTSMATPHVAGVVARLLMQDTKATAPRVTNALLCDGKTDVVQNIPTDLVTVNRFLHVGASFDASLGGLTQCPLTCGDGRSGDGSESPCNDHGTCLDGVCRCEDGWKGANCELSLCPNNCGDHGRCGEKGCVCAWGYVGRECKTRWIDDVAAINRKKPNEGSTDGAPNHFPDSDGGDAVYKLTIDGGSANKDLLISTCNERTQFDTTLRIYSEDGAELAFEDDNDDCDHNSYASVIRTSLRKGTYYVAVDGYGVRDVGSYEVSVRCKGCKEREEPKEPEVECGDITNKRKCKKLQKKGLCKWSNRNGKCKARTSRSLLRGGF